MLVYLVFICRHGVRQLLSAWADGPAYITQCPIKHGNSYVHKFRIVDQRGTLFYHAHITWLRATVYGAFIILPKINVPYPLASPIEDIPLLIGKRNTVTMVNFSMHLFMLLILYYEVLIIHTP